MKKRHILFTVLFSVAFNIAAQNDSIVNRLKEVVIFADSKLTKNSQGYKVKILNDSILINNRESFTSLLRFNSLIYFKEYGSGGTSSASFRGTSASDTAVIWNGININSINNGQTGFNSMTVSLFDAVAIRSGGGSIEYGSGSVGGTIHLNDQLLFSPKELIKRQIVTSVGSFDTYSGLYKLKVSNTKLALKIGAFYNDSENDYTLLGTRFKNANGAYNNLSLNASFAYKISDFSKLKLYSSKYFSERFLSGELPNPTSANQKYKDFNHRDLLAYHYKKNNFNHELKLSFLTQEYQYFQDKSSENYNFGKSKRYLVNYNLGHTFSELNATLTSYTEYESIFGKTDLILERNRKQFSQSLIYNQNLGNKVLFDVKIRKDFNSDYNVPFIYAFGLKMIPNRTLFFRINGSKNYRVPSYNDLYWPGQGNLKLIPETSLQSEAGIGFKNNKITTDLAFFYISAKDKITWTPSGDANRPGIWVPININKVHHKGVEFTFSYQQHFNKHALKYSVNYSYVEAKNSETKKILPFVPKHLFNGSFGYSYKKISFFYQQLFTGQVFTSESNTKDFSVPSFYVGNIGGTYRLFKNENQQVSIGFKVNNLFNEKYVVQPRRPMPNRNFNFNIHYIF